MSGWILFLKLSDKNIYLSWYGTFYMKVLEIWLGKSKNNLILLPFKSALGQPYFLLPYCGNTTSTYLNEHFHSHSYKINHTKNHLVYRAVFSLVATFLVIFLILNKKKYKKRKSNKLHSNTMSDKKQAKRPAYLQYVFGGGSG